MAAATSGHEVWSGTTEAQLRAWVEANPQRVNDCRYEGNTPLYLAAARFRSLPLTLWLLDEKGADVNCRNMFEATPLHGARSPDIITALFDRGVDPILVDEYGRSPLMTHAHYAPVECLARLLEDERVRADINSQDLNGNTALHFACTKPARAEGNQVIPTVRLLLQAGANVLLINKRGQTPAACLGEAHPSYHAATIALLDQCPDAKKDPNKASVLIKGRRLAVAAADSTASYLQGRLARGQLLPRVALLPVPAGRLFGFLVAAVYNLIKVVALYKFVMWVLLFFSVSSTPAAPGEFPWAVQVRTDLGGSCSGSLIAPQWVLTAAHCFTNKSTGKQVAWTGTATIGTVNWTPMHGEDYDVIRFAATIHPAHNQTTNRILPAFKYDPVFMYDLALLHLATPTRFTPVPLVDGTRASSVVPGKEVISMGWGMEKRNQHLGSLNVPIVAHDECQGGADKLLNICTSGIFESLCQGDSGGPSVMRFHDTWVQVGVTGGGIDLNSSTIFGPSVLVRISPHVPWIRAVTGLPAPRGPGLHL